MGTNLEKAFLDYYEQNNISPVSQDISNIDKHFQRRDSLYRLCGIPPLLIKDKTILEIGPGTGHNSLYTNYHNPSKYVLVDGNKKSIEETTLLMNKHFNNLQNCEVIHSNFDDFSYDSKFDIVLCEGTIPGQKYPEEFLKKVSNFVKPSGILLITCVDYVSVLAETLRKILARLILNNQDLSEIEKLNKIKPYFENSLSSLKGMSRSIDDWIYDNLLQPILSDKFFSIKDAILSLSDEFDAYSSSPNFNTDWRWYKDIHSDKNLFNNIFIKNYEKNIHNFLDYRFIHEVDKKIDNSELMNLSKKIFEISIEIQKGNLNRKLIIKVKEHLLKIIGIIQFTAKETSFSINEYVSVLENYLENKPIPKNLHNFDLWYGRGQQYISFIKK